MILKASRSIALSDHLMTLRMTNRSETKQETVPDDCKRKTDIGSCDCESSNSQKSISSEDFNSFNSFHNKKEGRIFSENSLRSDDDQDEARIIALAINRKKGCNQEIDLNLDWKGNSIICNMAKCCSNRKIDDEL